MRVEGGKSEPDLLDASCHFVLCVDHEGLTEAAWLLGMTPRQIWVDQSGDPLLDQNC